MKKRTLKVFGCGLVRRRSQNLRVIVAESSWAAAARALDIPLRHLRVYGAITGNSEEVALALSQPGSVFWTVNDYPRGPWTRGRP